MDNSKICYTYDNEDSVCGIEYNGTTHYFLKNLQGDIIAIVDKDAQVVAKYSYDAWGVCTITQDTSGCNIAHINPFRYRCYFFDVESQLYYLQSRYYDANVGRLVNADEAVYICDYSENINENEFVLYNSLAYCNNSPIYFYDPSGYYVMYLYGKDQSNSASINETEIKKKHLVYKYLISDEADFTKVWNTKGVNSRGKPVTIDIMIINLHGNPRGVAYVNFSKLTRRTIDTLILLSCNAGHLDYKDTNPAAKFYLNNNIRQLVCCDGTHVRKSHSSRRVLFFFKTKGRVELSVVGDEIFKGYLKKDKKRKSRGFILYTGKRGRTISGYYSIGSTFKNISSLLKKVGKW